MGGKQRCTRTTLLFTCPSDRSRAPIKVTIRVIIFYFERMYRANGEECDSRIEKETKTESRSALRKLLARARRPPLVGSASPRWLSKIEEITVFV